MNTEKSASTKARSYQELLDDELFEVERRSQQQAGWFMALCVLVVYLVTVFQYEKLLPAYQHFVNAMTFVLLLWFVGNSLLIRYGYYHRVLKYINIIFQVSVVSFFLLVTARVMGVKFALSSVAPLFYVVVIGVSSLTLNPFLCLLTGGFAAGQFLGMYGLWLHQEIDYSIGQEFVREQSLFGWPSVILRAVIFLIMGIAAMFMARKARSLLETVVVQVRYEEQLNFVNQDIKQAAEIQEKLIPADKPEFSGLDIESYYQPSRMVGGDYFDFIRRTPDDFLIVIADVSGKGFSAAMLMSNIQAMVQVLAQQEMSLEELMTVLNQAVCKTSARGRFVSLVCMQFNPGRRQLRYINCGHNAPVLFHRDGSWQQLEAGATILGVDVDAAYTVRETRFTSGDLVFAYTDGLSELRNADKTVFDERCIVDVLKQVYTQPAAEIKEVMLRRIKQHLGTEQAGDDLSFLCVKAK